MGKALGQRLLEVAVDPGNGIGQGRGEVDQRSAHLVGHAQRDRPQVVGGPEFLNRGQQPAASILAVGGADLVELAQDSEDPGQLVDRRPAARLRGMRGHDQTQLGPVQQQLDVSGCEPRLGQGGHGLADRARARGRWPPLCPRCLRRLGVAGPQAPHALVVLGEVDELKPAGQGPHENLGTVEIQLSGQRGELIGRRRVAKPRLTAQAHCPVQERDRRGPLRQSDDLAQDFGEEALVGGEVALTGVKREVTHSGPMPSDPRSTAEHVRDRRLLPGRLHPPLAVNREPVLPDQSPGVPGEMAAAGQPGPDGDVEDPLRPGRDRGVRDHMLEVAQAPVGPQDPMGLGQRSRRVGHRAQGQREDDVVEAALRERKISGHGVEDAHRHRGLRRRLHGESAQVGLGFHGDDLLHGPRIVGEVQAVTRPDLQHPAGETGKELVAVSPEPT